jgi:hypothetical protein
MPVDSRFPSALRREHGDSGGPTIRKGPSRAEVAMMTSDQLRAFYKSIGKWAEPDREAISQVSNPEGR